MPVAKMSADRRSRVIFFFQAEDGIRVHCVTGVQTCALPIYPKEAHSSANPAGVGPLWIGGRMRFLRIVGLRMGMVLRPCISGKILRTTRGDARSEERRVGKEGRSRGSPDH